MRKAGVGLLASIPAFLFFMAKLKVGDPAPDFSLPSQTGALVSLSSFREKKSVVLYFYPKDFTPGCTQESCAFRDQYEIFQQTGAEVIGVSGDSPDSHKRFAQEHRLPFLLLSDADGKAQKLYGISKFLGLVPGRVTFVIDKKGVIRHIFSSLFKPERHIEESLSILRSLD